VIAVIAVLAQSDLVTLTFWSAVLAAGVRLAVSVGTAAIGEMINERAGVLNLGLEGVMLLGGFAGFAASFESGSPWVGLISAWAAGAVVGAAFAALVVLLRVDQVVAGLGLTLFGIAFTAFLDRELYGGGSSPPRAPRPTDVEIPLLSDVPLVGEALFAQNLVVYVAVALVVAVSLFLRRSYWRIVVDAAGEAPDAADAAGHSVSAVRFLATIAGCSLGGFAGAVLIVGQLGFFNTNITAGRGWIALALVIFGRWRPVWIVAGAVLFGALDALQFRFQTLDSSVPFEFFIALPFVVTLVALCIGGRSGAAPSALGRPFVRTTE
jgi:simple sugar transport system permease protein